MFCCACAGQCNHTGPHTYCFQHGGLPAYSLLDVVPAVEAQNPLTGAWEPAEPLGWQDETEDTPAWLRRFQRALIAAVDAWRGQRRDWRAGADW